MTSLKDRAEELAEQILMFGLDLGTSDDFKGDKAYMTARKNYLKESTAQILDLFQQEVMATLPEKKEHKANCEADDKFCTCGAKYFNQSISDMESRLKERLEQ